jgi:hypothetical protein
MLAVGTVSYASYPPEAYIYTYIGNSNGNISATVEAGLNSMNPCVGWDYDSCYTSKYVETQAYLYKNGDLINSGYASYEWATIVFSAQGTSGDYFVVEGQVNGHVWWHWVYYEWYYWDMDDEVYASGSSDVTVP